MLEKVELFEHEMVLKQLKWLKRWKDMLSILLMKDVDNLLVIMEITVGI